MSVSSSTAANIVALTEELEKLEQKITLTLQEIDRNFSRSTRIVTDSLIPTVDRYASQCHTVWQRSEFWKHFFESSANVSLSGYEEPIASGSDENNEIIKNIVNDNEHNDTKEDTYRNINNDNSNHNKQYSSAVMALPNDSNNDNNSFSIDHSISFEENIKNDNKNNMLNTINDKNNKSIDESYDDSGSSLEPLPVLESFAFNEETQQLQFKPPRLPTSNNNNNSINLNTNTNKKINNINPPLAVNRKTNPPSSLRPPQSNISNSQLNKPSNSTFDDSSISFLATLSMVNQSTPGPSKGIVKNEIQLNNNKHSNQINSNRNPIQNNQLNARNTRLLKTPEIRQSNSDKQQINQGLKNNKSAKASRPSQKFDSSPIETPPVLRVKDPTINATVLLTPRTKGLGTFSANFDKITQSKDQNYANDSFENSNLDSSPFYQYTSKFITEATEKLFIDSKVESKYKSKDYSNYNSDYNNKRDNTLNKEIHTELPPSSPQAKLIGNTNQVIHRVLDSSWKLQVTPLKPKQPSIGLSGECRSQNTLLQTPNDNILNAIHKSDTLLSSSPLVARPSKTFTSHNSIQNRLSTSNSHQRDQHSFKNHNSIQNHEEDLDLNSMSESDLFSPPLTLKYSLPPSRVLQTPSRDAAQSMVDDVLRSVGTRRDDSSDDSFTQTSYVKNLSKHNINEDPDSSF